MQLPSVLQDTILTSDCCNRKIARGFAAFERNTGAAHPNDNKSLKNVKKLAKRITGKVALEPDEDRSLWQGEILVGTPANSFTGEIL